jgi:hypothetical protein
LPTFLTHLCPSISSLRKGTSDENRNPDRVLQRLKLRAQSRQFGG